MKVFAYMGIKPNWFCPQEVCIVCVTGEEKKDCINCPKVSIVTELDGNLMVQAINAMQSKGDWSKFIAFCYKRNTLGNDFMSWLFGDPVKFFSLMEEALKEGVIGNE